MQFTICFWFLGAASEFVGIPCSETVGMLSRPVPRSREQQDLAAYQTLLHQPNHFGTGMVLGMLWPSAFQCGLEASHSQF